MSRTGGILMSAIANYVALCFSDSARWILGEIRYNSTEDSAHLSIYYGVIGIGTQHLISATNIPKDIYKIVPSIEFIRSDSIYSLYLKNTFSTLYSTSGVFTLLQPDSIYCGIVARNISPINDSGWKIDDFEIYTSSNLATSISTFNVDESINGVRAFFNNNSSSCYDIIGRKINENALAASGIRIIKKADFPTRVLRVGKNTGAR